MNYICPRRSFKWNKIFHSMSQGIGSFEPTLKSTLFPTLGVFERSCKHGAAWKQNPLVKLGSKNQKSKTINSLQSDNLSDPELSPCDQSKRQDEKRVEPHRACHFTSAFSLSLQTCAIQFVFSVMFCRHVHLSFFISFDGGQNICHPTYRVRVVMY